VRAGHIAKPSLGSQGWGARPDRTAFEGKTVEMMGTSEEAEVSKTARVVGEVSLNKQTNEREQTVRDTVRRTDVEVEEVEPSSR
jgi:stress response protein YsnF